MERIALYNWLSRAYTGAADPEPLNDGDIVEDYEPPRWFTRSIVMEKMGWTAQQYWDQPMFVIRDLLRTWSVQSQVERDHRHK